MSFVIKAPEEYELIFGINGIFTDFKTQEWTIKIVDDNAFIFRLFDASEIIILSCFYLIILMLSAHMVKGYWMVIPIFAWWFYLFWISLKDYENKFYIITVYTFTGVVWAFILYSLYVYLVDSWIRKKEPNYFYNKKRKFYFEYVYQKLNGHPSNYWINKHKKLNMDLRTSWSIKTGDSSLIIYGGQYYNIFTSLNSKYEKSLMDSNYTQADEESKSKNSLSDDHISYEGPSIQSKESLLESGEHRSDNSNKFQPYSIKKLKKIPVDVKLYNNLSLWRKYIRIFTPFEIMFKSIWVNDWFIYPQFLLTCILICFFSIIYFSYFVFESLLGTLQLLNDSFDQVYENSFNFIRNGVERYFELFKYEATTKDLDLYFSKLISSSNNYDELLFAMELGALVGLTIAVIIVFVNMLSILYDYKKWVLDARIGVFRFRKDQISIKYYSTLSGAIISNSIFMFFVIIITMTVIFIFVAWPLFWRILWYYKWNLILLWAIGLGAYCLKYLVKSFLFGHDYIKNRTLLSLADFILLQLSIISGIFSSILRFVKLIWISFISIMKINVNSMPYWLSESMHIDSFNNAYYASIMIQHTHNNPVVITFHNLLFMVTTPVKSSNNFYSEKDKKELVR